MCIPLFILSLHFAGAEPTTVDYSRDIQPILADKCFRCHGPDAATRQADLRLDQRATLEEDRGGYRIIDLAKPSESELYRRITSDDPDIRMPPPQERLQLEPEEIDRLRQWIAQGAKVQQHWSFLPVERPELPRVHSEEWVSNPIDRFILAKLESANLRPSPEAEKSTLIRRLSMDLRGLPPSKIEVDEFLADTDPDAYERLVDRFLQSPQYGERMALVWLDAARFADSGGYQGDILRSMWLWRDWVINAYNRNVTFDRFTIEQLAGDLLPNSSIDQQIATGFHRNHRINDEDGIIHEEFRVEYVADRVDTTATVWLGLTIGCARCHDHKYDPISQREYYSLFAYFNSVDESGRGHGNAPPLLSVPDKTLAARIAQTQQQLAAKQQAAAACQPGSDEAQQFAEEVTALQKTLNQLQASAPTVMVMKDLPEPRATFVLQRGAYDQPGEVVTPATPEVLSERTGTYEKNRLGLARWLMDPNHPLTARVAVNRYWQMYFGKGLVETPEDFGIQGKPPTHPELLDWLASEFIRTGWDIKRMQRLIVTSSTYKQSSAGSEERLQKDPENRLLGRAPRFRLDAEFIRDQALCVSGLMSWKIGGPSVKPYQPAKLWNELASASVDYVEDKGASLYRRSLYTFVRRTVPPPGMTVFDAPNRELCSVRRARTNTPLQALNLMNDPIYVESCRALAERILCHPCDDRARLISAWKTVLSREPSERELALLTDSLTYYRQRYHADVTAATELIGVGESKPDTDLPPAELAAYTAICSILLNLDEAVTRE